MEMKDDTRRLLALVPYTVVASGSSVCSLAIHFLLFAVATWHDVDWVESRDGGSHGSMVAGLFAASVSSRSHTHGTQTKALTVHDIGFSNTGQRKQFHTGSI
jgi:hypothetical protein